MKLKEAQDLAFSQKPVFAKLYREYKDKTWFEYSKKNYLNRGLESSRAGELVETFKKLLSPLFTKEKVASAMKTLKETGFVSTADHHGVLCHPFFSNSALLSNQIHLTCGGVSISNSSYPRGVFFHDSNLKQVRIPFVSLHTKHLPIYGHPPISKEKILREIEKIESYKLPKKQKRILKNFLKKIADENSVWNKNLYSEQLTIVNDLFWEMLFGKSRGTLIYLEVESLVRQLLLDTEIKRFIFDETHRDSYIKNYEGIIGAHETKNKKGSHLFWFIDRKSRTRRQLWIKKGYLETDDRQVKIKLEQKSIREALESYSLMPTMALCYSILSFHYGLTLGGGFSQIQYLGEMEKAYVRGFGSMGDREKRFGSMGDRERTNIFSGEFVAIGLGNEKSSVPASLLDILLWGGEEKSERIAAQFKKIAIGESLDLMMPEFIHILTGTRPKLADLKKPPKTFYVSK